MRFTSLLLGRSGESLSGEGEMRSYLLEGRWYGKWDLDFRDVLR